MIEYYIRNLAEEYNVEIQLLENRRHIDIFPPHGGAMVINYAICIGDQYTEIGCDYGTSTETMKKNALEAVKKYLENKDKS